MQGTKPRPDSRAFTRTELLLLTAMCCVLLPVLTVASQRSDEDVRRVQCRSNLKQIGQWLLDYGKDHDTMLPSRSSGGWPWDVYRTVWDQAAQYGLSFDALYCPSGPAEGAVLHFNFSEDLVVGTYVLTMSAAMKREYRNLTTVPPTVRVDGQFVTLKAEERELAADPTLSFGGDRTTANFTEILGGSFFPHRTAHLDGEVPAGGNVLFLDGHVEWRTFNEMQVRSAGTYPAFWF